MKVTKEDRILLRKLCQMGNGDPLDSLAIRCLDTIDALESELEKTREQVGTRVTYNQGLYHDNEALKERVGELESERDSLHELNKTMKQELTSELRASEFLSGTLYLVAVTAVAYLRQGKTAEAMAELEQVTGSMADRWSEEEEGQ